MAEQAGARNDPPAIQPPAILAGSRVVLLISKGPSPSLAPVYVGVPDVTFKSQGDALNSLQDSGLTARVFDEAHEKVPHGHVIAQTPEGGQMTLADAEIVLLVSSGHPDEHGGYVPLPNVVGRAEAEAVATVRAAGLSAQTVHDFSPTVPSGIVIDQIPNTASVATPVKRSLVWLWVLIAVIAVGVIAAGAFGWFNRRAPVPNVTGMAQQNAQSAIVAAGFKVGSVSTTQTAQAADVGKVVAQTPTPGKQARLGSAINVVVSGGQSLVKVPDLSGLTQAQAQDALKNVGLKATIVSGNSSTVTKGQVMSQAPQAGQLVPVGTSIGVTVSQGPQSVAVPLVVEMTQGDATAILTAAGLTVSVVRSPNSAPVGDVYAQAPDQGTMVQPGSTISIHVSSGPAPELETVQVPDVIGNTESQATSTLQDLGFEVAVTQIAGGTAGQVVGQAPAEGTLEFKGATISILVSTGSAP